ncbi:MAG: protein arginine kinase [Chlamydiales bacterium]|nr:protein arginine kinase [Chlamydiales bacterium]
MKKGKRESHPIFQLKNPWDKHSHNVWLASTLSVSRNLNKFKFPSKLDKTREQQVLSLIWEGFKSMPELKNPSLYRSEEIGPLQKEFLLEHFLVQNSFHQAHAGEGFILDESAEILGVVNLNDHLQMKVIDTQQEIEKSWNRLVKMEGHLSKSLDFAFNPRFGFLMADPRHSGTGLTVSLFLHIPAVIHTGELPELLEREKEEEVEAVGLQGKTSEMIGDILVARNTCTIGLTEEYILTTMRMWATRAVVAEISIRKKLMENNNEQIKNKVTRALGLLTHSYQLEVIEALNALSLVKLGVEIGWILAPEKLNLNQVLFNCRRAHLLSISKDSIEIPELPKRRAEYLHEIASQLKLSI